MEPLITKKTVWDQRQAHVESFRNIEKQPLEEEKERLMKHIDTVYSIPIAGNETWYLEQEKEIGRLYAIKRDIEIKLENS